MFSRTRFLFTPKAFAYYTAGTVAAAGGGYWYLNSGPAYPASTRESRRPPPPWLPPTREQNLNALKNSGRGLAEDDQIFNLLIVGGGATGAGVAVDATTRGLKVAMVERDDFSAGTSSKSTKLVHGGVRYLQKAILELDYEQYKLVKEALHERKIFLETAPYLSHMLPIMLPIYKYWQIPYYWIGCKMYDVLAGKENMESSYLMSKGKALETFPMLKSDGLVGALVYYDGQHNDSRMNMALVMTAVKYGATVANKVEVVKLHKDAEGKLHGARLKDKLTGDEWDVQANGIINATGPFSDTLLTLDNPAHKPIVQPSSGIHITLPNYYSPRTMGLLDPATSDGRVIFFLPWQGNTIAGTTDAPASVDMDKEPKAREEEIRWVLEEVRRYLSPDIKVRRGDVLSAWSGLRPLVRNPSASSTQGLVRNHMIHVSDSGLLTIAGGKWTTYRAMAEETVDEAVKVFGLEGKVKSGCVTDKVRLVGSDGWSRNMFIGLTQRYGLASEVAQHLAENYGDRAWTVLALAKPTGESWPKHGIKLAPQYPFIEAEVRYAIRHEYALTAIDVLARRTRLSFLNSQAALEALPRVVELMADELNWSRKRQLEEIQKCTLFLESMGLPEGTTPPKLREPTTLISSVKGSVWSKVPSVPFVGGKSLKEVEDEKERRDASSFAYSRTQFEPGEVDELKVVFEDVAKATEGATIATGQMRKLVTSGSLRGYEGVGGKDFDYVMEETGYAKTGNVDFEEFVEICAELKDVVLVPKVTKSVHKATKTVIPVEKSGGGV